MSFLFLHLGRPSRVVVGSNSGRAAWVGDCAMLLQRGDRNANVSQSFKNKKRFLVGGPLGVFYLLPSFQTLKVTNNKKR